MGEHLGKVGWEPEEKNPIFLSHTHHFKPTHENRSGGSFSRDKVNYQQRYF